MRKALPLVGVFFLAAGLQAGFKVKLVKPKKPEQFQARTVVDGVTFAADLLLKGSDQKDYFYKELTPANVIAIRLAVFNRGKHEVTLPFDTIRLNGPDGAQHPLIDPASVAQAILQGRVLTAGYEPRNPGVVVAQTPPDGDPRDPTNPGYDPRRDPRRNPTYDPRQPGSGGYDPWGRPSVDIVFNPGGGTVSTGDLSPYEKALVEKDFADKCHSGSPILAPLTRDRFLYFLVPETPVTSGSWTLRLGPGKGIGREVVLQFSQKSR